MNDKQPQYAHGTNFTQSYPPLSSELSRKANEAGRDGACIFRSLLKTRGFAVAARKASNIILDQCPAGYLTAACLQFELHIDKCYKARVFEAISGKEFFRIIQEDPLTSLADTLQMSESMVNFGEQLDVPAQ